MILTTLYLQQATFMLHLRLTLRNAHPRSFPGVIHRITTLKHETDRWQLNFNTEYLCTKFR